MAEHTKLPWRALPTEWGDGCSHIEDADGNQIVDGRDIRGGELKTEHAVIIVKAVNNHARLVEALENVVERMERARDILTQGNPRPECNWGMLHTEFAREALAAVESDTD